MHTIDLTDGDPYEHKSTVNQYIDVLCDHSTNIENMIINMVTTFNSFYEDRLRQLTL